MAISKNKEQRQKSSLIESTATVGQVAQAICNPDGSNVGVGGGTGDVNVIQLGGNSINLGSGAAGTGTQRTITATDSPDAVSLAAIKLKTDNIPAQGQALAAASTPVVLTAIQVSALTPTTISKNAGVVDTNTQRVIEAGSSTSSVTSVADTASSTQLLASTPGRIKYSVFNNSTEILYLKNGTTASLASFTVAIPPLSQFGYYEDDTYTGRVDGIWANDSTGAALITEYT